MTLWATPSNPRTANALTPTTREPDVEIRITREEYDAEQDHRWDTPKHVPGGWSPAVDLITGKAVQLRSISCGGDCKCAMEVKLA